MRFWSDDPRAALEYIEAFDYGDGVHAQSARNSQLRGVALSWGISDPETAVAWAEERGLPEVADEVRGAALVRMATSGEQVQAASELLEHLNGVAGSADGATSRLQGPVTQVARTWARRDPEAAAEWVAEIPVEDFRNRAALQVASEWGDFAPEAALEWADGLADAGMRDQALRGAFRAMASRDLAAANEAITTVTMSEAERTGVLEEIGKIAEGGSP